MLSIICCTQPPTLVQGDRHACIQLTAKVKIIRLGHERHRPLAVKGMTVSAAAGSKPRFTLQLGGPLGSALTRVTARLAGFDDKRLDKQRKTVEVSQARRAATFEAPRGMSSQELQSIAAAVRTGRLQPVVHSWLEKVPEPAAGAVVLELRPSEAEVSVRNADGQAVQITAAAAEEARQQLWARLGEDAEELPTWGRMGGVFGCFRAHERDISVHHGAPRSSALSRLPRTGFSGNVCCILPGSTLLPACVMQPSCRCQRGCHSQDPPAQAPPRWEHDGCMAQQAYVPVQHGELRHACRAGEPSQVTCTAAVRQEQAALRALCPFS